MSVTNYISMDGMLIGEMTSGVMRNYGTDALGSVVETVLNGVEENTYQYKPYGGLLAKTGVAADPSYLWNGGSGYRATKGIYYECYIRFRNLASILARWNTVDLLWPNEASYTYLNGNPLLVSDPSGMGAGGFSDPSGGGGSGSCIKVKLKGPYINDSCVNVTYQLFFSVVPPCVSGYIVQKVTRSAVYNSPCYGSGAGKPDPNANPNVYYELWEIDAKGNICQGYCNGKPADKSQEDDFQYVFSGTAGPPQGDCGSWILVGIMKFFSGPPPQWSDASYSGLPTTTDMPANWEKTPTLFQRYIYGSWNCYMGKHKPIIVYGHTP